MKQFFLKTMAALTISHLTLVSGAFAADSIKISAEQQDMFGIRTVKPSVMDALWSNAFPGEVTIPNNQKTAITSLHSGLVVSLKVTEGMSVTKGDLLAQIASPDFLEHQREYLDALTVFNTSMTTLTREKTLYEGGIISLKRLNETKAERDQAQSQLNQSEQSLALSGLSNADISTLRTTRLIIRLMPIRASMTGQILRQGSQVGENVTPASAIYTVGFTNPLWVKMHVPMGISRSILVGNVLTLEQPKISGTVKSVGRMIHDADQGITVIAEISENTEKLIPGQFVSAKIELAADQTSGFKIPRQTIFTEAGLKYVFKKTPDGFIPVEVTIIIQEQDHYIVQAKLTSNDFLASSGLATLKGMWLGLGSEE